MSRNLKVLITLFSMTALYGVYYWGIPAIIDLPNNIDLIEQAVLKKSGYKISIQNPSLKMGLIPAIKIKANDFAILNVTIQKLLISKNLILASDFYH